jgi:hypothetical protein
MLQKIVCPRCAKRPDYRYLGHQRSAPSAGDLRRPRNLPSVPLPVSLPMPLAVCIRAEAPDMPVGVGLERGPTHLAGAGGAPAVGDERLVRNGLGPGIHGASLAAGVADDQPLRSRPGQAVGPQSVNILGKWPTLRSR